VLQTIKQLEQIDGIVSAEPNRVLSLDSTNPNDPEYRNGNQWALSKISAPQAWSTTTGNANVNVGVIDTGLASHSDLNSNVHTTVGWNFVNNNFLTGADPGGHGTRVAGVIGAVGNNGIGITGVSQRVTLVPLKAGPSSSGSGLVVSAVASAVNYATDHKIPILNFSGGTSSNSTALYTAVRNYPGLFVTSAGNNGANNDLNNNSSLDEPSIYGLPNVISVGSTQSNDTRSSHSNFGLQSVHLFAPGSSILSTCAKFSTNSGCSDSCTSTSSRRYCQSTGTSLAAPHVAGVAALLLSAHPNRNQNPRAITAQIKWAILDGADNISALNGLSVTGGRLNANRALSRISSYSRHGVHNIRSVSTGRYLEMNTANPASSSGVSLVDWRYRGRQQWVVHRRPSDSSDFHIRSSNTFNGGTNGGIGGLTGTTTNGNVATISTAGANQVIRIVRNTSDGTVTFRLGSSTGLALTANANNTVTWTTHTGADSQRWLLEAHRLTHMIGDINQDGRISSSDVTLIDSYIRVSNPVHPTAVRRFLADANKDGNVNQTDRNLIQSWVS
jgi:hypothetical protein